LAAHDCAIRFTSQGTFLLNRSCHHAGVDWVVVITVSVSVVLHCRVVLREKRYLEGKFGEAYREI
jgi:protein-S-isoprenylcysteine O-methyltransferase Ste14